jgi:hypothetical protein
MVIKPRGHFKQGGIAAGPHIHHDCLNNRAHIAWVAATGIDQIAERRLKVRVVKV